MKHIQKFNDVNETSKLKIQKFLDELTILSKKYNIYLETTDDMYMEDDGGDIGSIKFDYNLDKYISE